MILLEIRGNFLNKLNIFMWNKLWDRFYMKVNGKEFLGIIFFLENLEIRVFNL